MSMRAQSHRRKRVPFTVRVWDLLPLETQVILIQRGLVDPSLIAVDTDFLVLPRLVITESLEELETLMKEKPRYTIFQPSLRGLRSPKAKDD